MAAPLLLASLVSGFVGRVARLVSAEVASLHVTLTDVVIPASDSLKLGSRCIVKVLREFERGGGFSQLAQRRPESSSPCPDSTKQLTWVWSCLFVVEIIVFQF